MFETMPEPAPVKRFADLLKINGRLLSGLARRYRIGVMSGRTLVLIRDDVRAFLPAPMRYEPDSARTLDLAFLTLCQAADQRTADRVTYFIRAADRTIKIGFTNGLERRVKAIQACHAHPPEVLASVKGGMTLEQQTHRRFKAHRLNGEWFAPAPELISFIGNLRGRTVDA